MSGGQYQERTNQFNMQHIATRHDDDNTCHDDQERAGRERLIVTAEQKERERE